MANTTNRGLVYPTSGDNIAPLETVFATLATTTNDAIPLIGEESFTGPIDTETQSVVSVAFESAFASAPIVMASIIGTSSSPGYTMTVYSVTTTGFSARVARLSGTAITGENLKLQYLAK